MKTIPDLIADIKWYYKCAIDRPLSWKDDIGIKINLFGWKKRWRNREEGTGYKKRPGSEVFEPAPREDDTQ